MLLSLGQKLLKVSEGYSFLVRSSPLVLQVSPAVDLAQGDLSATTLHANLAIQSRFALLTQLPDKLPPKRYKKGIFALRKAGI